MSEINLTIKDMSAGLRRRLDEPNEPAGSFRSLTNAKITVRGGLAKRDGISVIGDYDSSGNSIVGLYAYEKSDGTKTLIKANGTVHSYLDTTWETFESGITAARKDYAPHVINTENDDYLYFSDRENGYRRWKGWHDRTTSALAGGETEIPVSSVLKADIYAQGTASSVSTTTLDVSGTPWSADQWNGFHVRITSGAQSGKISLISATTSGQVTFTAISGLSGTPTFEIRQLDLPATGTVILNGSPVAYTGITNDDSLTVTSAPAAADDSPIAINTTSYPAAPKGDALDVWLTKMMVANIKSAIGKDGSGNDVATSVSRAVYVSNTEDATDFSFSAPRSADEGDIISFSFGGGKVLDVIAQEDKMYAGTPNYIEGLYYTQSTDATGNPTDLLQREPLKPGYGITSRFVRGTDDIYFFTPQGVLTSIGRVASKDTTPQTVNISFPFQRLIEDRDNDEADGIEWRNRLHFCHKSSSSVTHNDRVLVYNLMTKSCEGDWLLPASSFAVWEGKPCFGCSNSGNVMRMYDGLNDVWDGMSYPISSVAKGNWINITSSGMEEQSVTGLHVAGYIKGNSSGTYHVYTDFSETPALSVTISGNESDFTYSATVSGYLGGVPLGTEPLASIDEADVEGNRRFRFTAWFPDIYCSHFSWGWESSGKDEYIETNQVGITVSSDPLSVAPGLVKT